MTRQIRTNDYRHLVEEEWAEKYFNFYLQHSNKHQQWWTLSQNPNITPKIIQNSLDLHLPVHWDYPYLSSNQNITLPFIKKYIDKPWDWNYISCNSSISLHDIEMNPQLPWNWQYISLNPNITFNFIKRHKDKPLNWKELTCSKNISLKDIVNNPELPWVEDYIIFNPEVTVNDIINSKIKWSASQIPFKKGIPFSFILNRLEIPWNWTLISAYGNIDINDVKNNLHFPWNWSKLSYHSKMDLKTIYNNMDLPWDWNIIYDYYRLNEDTIEEYKIKSANFTKCSELMTIDELLKEHQENNGEYNNNINYWSWHKVSRNSRITMNDINTNIHLPWNWHGVSLNKFKYDKEQFILDKYRKYIAVYQIQQRWNECISNPEYIICKKKIQRDYNKYFH
tara:strand:+ start:190 stop:1371 length:1182 start_codon:yes stop_codon:yes gene_type:complete